MKPPTAIKQQQEVVAAEREANRLAALAQLAEEARVSRANRRVMVRVLISEAARRELAALPAGPQRTQRVEFFKRLLNLVDSTFAAALDAEDWHRSVQNKLSCMGLWNPAARSIEERRNHQHKTVEASNKAAADQAAANEAAATVSAAADEIARARLPHNSPWTAAYDGPKVGPKAQQPAATPAPKNEKSNRRSPKGRRADPYTQATSFFRAGQPMQYYAPMQMPFQQLPPQYSPMFWAQQPQHVWQNVQA